MADSIYFGRVIWLLKLPFPLPRPRLVIKKIGLPYNYDIFVIHCLNSNGYFFLKNMNSINLCFVITLALSFADSGAWSSFPFSYRPLTLCQPRHSLLMAKAR